MNYPWTISASISSYNQLTSTNQTQTYSKSDHSASDTLKLCGNISNGSPSPHRSELVPCLSAIFGPDFSMFQRIEDTARLEKCRGWTIRLCLDQSSHEQAMLRPVIPWTCSWLEDTEIVAICRLPRPCLFGVLRLVCLGFDRSTIWWHQAPLRMYTRWRAASRCDPKKWSTCGRIFKPSFKPSSYWRLNPIVELQPLECYVMLYSNRKPV
jgi:hypothetical protein